MVSEDRKIQTSGNSLVFVIPSAVVKSCKLQKGDVIKTDLDYATGEWHVYLNGRPKSILDIDIPEWFGSDGIPLARSLIGYLKANQGKLLSQLMFLCKSKRQEQKLFEILQHYIKNQNIYLKDSHYWWADNLKQVPKDLAKSYHVVTPAESAQIAQHNAVFEAKLNPKIDESELDASLEAEVVDVLKNKEKPVIVKKEG